MRSYIPKIFYIEEKAWNYYPYTITGKLTVKAHLFNSYTVLTVKLGPVKSAIFLKQVVHEKQQKSTDPYIFLRDS